MRKNQTLLPLSSYGASRSSFRFISAFLLFCVGFPYWQRNLPRLPEILSKKSTAGHHYTPLSSKRDFEPREATWKGIRGGHQTKHIPAIFLPLQLSVFSREGQLQAFVSVWYIRCYLDRIFIRKLFPSNLFSNSFTFKEFKPWSNNVPPPWGSLPPDVLLLAFRRHSRRHLHFVIYF